MNAILNALLPIIIIIFLGIFLKKSRLVSIHFWAMADKLNYFIFLPALLVGNLAQADINIGEYSTLFAAISLAHIVIFVLLLALHFIFRYEPKGFTSITQGALRFNTYVFLALVFAFFGAKGLVLGSLVMAVMIPICNFLCILIFSYYIQKGRFNVRNFIFSIIKNPPIFGCLVGLLLNALGVTLHISIINSISLLGKAALPIGLLVVGASMKININKNELNGVFFSTLFKLLVMPFLAYILCDYLHVEPFAAGVGILFCAMPTAVSSTALARALGGDVPLMANLISVQLIIAMGSIFVIAPYIH